MTLQYSAHLTLNDTDKAKKFKSHSKHGSFFIESNLSVVSELIETTRTPTKGRTPIYVKALEELDSDVIALTLLVVCLDSLIEPMGKLSLATRVSQYLVQELNYSTLEAANPGLVDAINRYTQTHRARRRIEDAVKGGEFGEVELIEWDQHTMHHVGLVLLELLVNAGWLEAVRYPGNKVDKYQWSPVVTEWADESYQTVLHYSPAYLPLTARPLGYTDEGVEMSYGCYFPPIQFRLGANHRSEQEPRSLKNGVNIQAADRLAQVPYELNMKVYKVVKELWELGHQVGKLPARHPQEIPNYPEGADEQTVKEWKLRAGRIHTKNAQTYGHRAYTARQLLVIDQFIDKELYFLWRADTRGRLYPVATTLLNPQGHDLSKGILKFHSSIAKPIGDKGWQSLLCAIAEHYGQDKISLKARQQWTIDNSQYIQDVAKDPIGQLSRWYDVDEPFQFLAGCIEFNEAVEQVVRGDIDSATDYVTGYIKYHDGKCSGVQHWSALLRDEKTAQSVALTPSTEYDNPPDLYSDVLAALLKDRLLANPIGEDQAVKAHLWWQSIVNQGLLSRSTVKPIVMTYVYGSTSRTWTNKLMDWSVEEGLLNIIERDHKDNDEDSPRSTLFKYCVFLSNCINDILKTHLSSTCEGMQWVRDCIKAINSKGHGVINWTAPGGFEVRQAYRKQNTERVRVRVKCLDVDVYLERQKLTNEVDKTRQVSAAPPNYIHSMDASHLCGSVVDFKGPMTVIHDSFGCLLSETEEMLSIVKSEFRLMYLVDNLQSLRTQWSELYPDADLPELPDYGSWSSEMVMSSTYAFS